MRISFLCLLFAVPLVGCGEQTADKNTLAAVETAQRRAAGDTGAIPCARNGATALQRACVIERTDSEQGLVLTIRHPDGAFRRLLVTKDGRGVVAADGAEPATVTIVAGDQIEVAVGGERYRLPATVKAGGAAR